MIESSFLNIIKQEAEALLPEVIHIRRHLHQHPELSFEEHLTSVYISEALKSFGIHSLKIMAKTGIVAIIEGQSPEKRCIALRADMDALPINELNDVAYKSKNKGVMHACGHDVHTACLLGVAKILNKHKDKFEGTIKLIFQPGEEKSPGGASLMMADGVLENPQPEAIFGLHVEPTLPSGTVGFRKGQYMASADEIHIQLKGKGGHAAMPHLALDPIPVAALIITSLQQIISRKANPFTPSVLTFGKIAGGFATNVIAEEVEILGTFRTMDETWRAEAKRLITKTTKAIANSHGLEVDIKMPPGYPSVYNHPELTQSAIDIATSILGNDAVIDLDKKMTAEDFAFYGQQIPACFYRIGTNKNNIEFLNSVHTPYFDIDEEAMVTAVKVMSCLAVWGRL